MKSISDDIRQWLHKQQDWLQDASERLLKKGLLNPADLKNLVARVKTADGQKVTGHRPFDSLAPSSSVGFELRLKSIGVLTGIEGLAPRRPLAFGEENLIVVYGHNGSGKSSYARLFKKVTGKPRALDLKPNVFQAGSVQGKCQFTYELGGAEVSTEWLANALPIAALRAVDIFDADEALHYLSNESAAAYTPPVVALFESLALACDQVRTQLKIEQDNLVKALPLLPYEYSATAAGKIYSLLKAEVAETTLSALLTWTDENEKTLNQATERFKTTDHAALAKKSGQRKLRCSRLQLGCNRRLMPTASQLWSICVHCAQRLKPNGRSPLKLQRWNRPNWTMWGQRPGGPCGKRLGSIRKRRILPSRSPSRMRPVACCVIRSCLQLRESVYKRSRALC